MSRLQEIVKSVIPRPIKQFLDKAHRDFVFRRAIKAFMRNPEACAHAGNRVLIDLIYGWGNEGWSALDEYLAACIHHVLRSDGPTLECGSGLSTIVLGVIAKKRGKSHWVLEDKAEWTVRVQQFLKRYNLDTVVLCETSLKGFGSFSWYDAPVESMPDFDLVICDGPPFSTNGGRYGLAPIMKKRLKRGCIILLDDAGREQERAIAERWKTELGGSFEIFGSTKPFIKMTVMNTRN